MKKIIPIKVEKALPMNYKFIEWKLHNVCNNDCSYCHSNNKNGTSYWLDINTYKKYTDKLVKMCNGEPFWIQITGGEPTLYPEFIELIKYIHDSGAYTALLSNGVRTLRWWEELKQTQSLDILTLTFHPEQTSNYKHIADVINLFHDEPVKTIINITHTKENINLAFEAFEYFKKNTGCISTIKPMIVELSEETTDEDYTEEQLKIFKNKFSVHGSIPNKKSFRVPDKYNINYQLKRYFNDNTIKSQDYTLLLKNKENNFYGWSCDIGKNTMRINGEEVYRGVCAVGDIKNLKDQNLDFYGDPVICDKKRCVCGTDMIATKTFNT